MEATFKQSLTHHHRGSIRLKANNNNTHDNVALFTGTLDAHMARTRLETIRD